MEQPERDFYNQLRQLLPGHVQRIESGSTSPGIPDLTVHANGIELWIELKASQHPAKWDIYIRKEQNAWGVAAATAGRQCWLIAKHGPPGVNNPRYGLWKFPHISVKPRGKTHKYVTVLDEPKLWSYNLQHLITYLFTTRPA